MVQMKRRRGKGKAKAAFGSQGLLRICCTFQTWLVEINGRRERDGGGGEMKSAIAIWIDL